MRRSTDLKARVLTTNIDLDEGIWREVAGEAGARAAEITRMASAFEHDDLKQARPCDPVSHPRLQPSRDIRLHSIRKSASVPCGWKTRCTWASLRSVIQIMQNVARNLCLFLLRCNCRAARSHFDSLQVGSAHHN